MPKSPSKPDVMLEQFGKAIGHRMRIRILRLLSRGSKSVQAVVDAVGPISQPAVSQHLRTLRNAKLVSGQRRGHEVYYSFNPKKYFGMLHALAFSIKRS